MIDQKIILFDIDRTLFNTELYVQTLKDKFNEWDYKYGNVNSAYKLYTDIYGETYKFDFFILLYKVISNEDLKCEMFDFIDQPLKSYVFNDVYESLKILSQNYRLGIFSEGSLYYQRNKFLKLGILDYIDPELVYIVPNKRIYEIISSLPECIIIDDNPDVLAAINKFSNCITTYHINRSGYENNLNCRLVNDLYEFVDLIN